MLAEIEKMDNKNFDIDVDRVEQVDVVEEKPISQDANEEIVRDLETHGEEVGMTWRTVMAVIVCIFFLKVVSETC